MLRLHIKAGGLASAVPIDRRHAVACLSSIRAGYLTTKSKKRRPPSFWVVGRKFRKNLAGGGGALPASSINFSGQKTPAKNGDFVNYRAICMKICMSLGLPLASKSVKVNISGKNRKVDFSDTQSG